jgi:hypothetical protein
MARKEKKSGSTAHNKKEEDFPCWEISRIPLSSFYAGLTRAAPTAGGSKNTQEKVAHLFPDSLHLFSQASSRVGWH